MRPIRGNFWASSYTLLSLISVGTAHFCTSPSLNSVTLEELVHGLDAGCFTSVDFVTSYLARIQAVDKEFSAVLETNSKALSIAKALDKERKSNHIRGPLHGIPILVKDNIATSDLLNTTAGSYALPGAKFPNDSTVVSKLRAAGAIILGKANLSEWAQLRSFNSTAGWSAVGNQTYGAHYPFQDPYGSSSGSAVATALGLGFASLGTDTHGSIIMPASRANCVGIRPTVGLTSRYGTVPISRRQDSVGPIARTVRDAAVILGAIAGVDEKDNYTSVIPNSAKELNYLSALDRHIDLNGLRIGVPRNGITSSVIANPMNDTIILNEFEKALAELIEAYTALENETVTTMADFVSGIAEYFSQLVYNPNSIQYLADLRAFTQNHPLEEYPARDTAVWDVALALGFNASDIRAYAAWQNSLRLDKEGGVTHLISFFDLDALVIPTEYAPTYVAAPGLPAITVPLGSYPPDTPVIKGQRELISVAPNIPFRLTFLGAK
ncbi:amidase [Bisporella sp. PMI_857]|nr:amidase [Bisporella sp. PMI_857]